jgi:hypothetical protein
MLELVGVDHRTDRLDQAVGDVEREDADHVAFGVVGHGTWLAVHHGRRAVGAVVPRPAEQPEQEPGHPRCAVQRLAPGQALATAVADHDHVRSEEVQQAVEVTAADRLEEPAGYLVPLLARGLEPGLALVDVVPGADEDLPAVRLGLAGDLGDLGVVVAEDLVEQEHGAFGG